MLDFHIMYTHIQFFLICLKLHLIQFSTCYDLGCSISFHVILFAYWIIWITQLYPHTFHIEMIFTLNSWCPWSQFFTDSSLLIDSLEFMFHRSPSSTSTPLHFKAFCFVAKKPLCLFCWSFVWLVMWLLIRVPSLAIDFSECDE